MANDFLHIDRFATLEDLHFLLFETLDAGRTIEGNSLSTICKEKCLNFAFAYENTLKFLEAISLVRIDKTKRVSRNPEENLDTAKVNTELSFFLLRKLCSYLEVNELLQRAFNDHTIVHNSKRLSLNTGKLPVDLVFIRTLFLNLRIAETSMDQIETVVVSEFYRSFFLESILTRTPKYETELVAPTKKTKFFVSYASMDEKYKDELKKHLRGLIDNGQIEYWDGKFILPGERWDDEIKNKIEQAEIILLLVSVDFMNSDYINDVELKRAIERDNEGQVKIIPILLRHCDFESSQLNKYHALPEGKVPIEKWPNKDEAYLNIVENIKIRLNASKNYK